MNEAANWPIGCNMMPFGNLAPDGSSLADAPATLWADHLAQVRELGFSHIDPADTWLPLGSMPRNRIQEFYTVLEGQGLRVSSISMTRNSVVDRKNGESNLATAHNLIDIAAELGATIVNIGFMQPLTDMQKKRLWFWLAKGHEDVPELRDLALKRVRELGDHALNNGLQISLEMYEDTYLGTADDAVSFIRDTDHPAVGLNPDIGNLVRLHRPIPPYQEMFEKVLPYSNFWHIKNYIRDENPANNSYASAPVPLKYGIINYRMIIRRALELGYSGPFCCEHYGSDSLGVSAENRDYIEEVLTQALASARRLSEVPTAMRPASSGA